MPEIPVILDDYPYITDDGRTATVRGTIVLDVDRATSRELGSWNNAVRRAVNGGTENVSQTEYIQQIESFGYREFTGTVVEGPPELIGEEITAVLETDFNTLYRMAMEGTLPRSEQFNSP